MEDDKTIPAPPPSPDSIADLAQLIGELVQDDVEEWGFDGNRIYLTRDGQTYRLTVEPCSYEESEAAYE